MLYFVFYLLVFLYVSRSRSVTSVGEEKDNSSFTSNYVVSVRRSFLLHLGAWNGLRYFIVALPVPFL